MVKTINLGELKCLFCKNPGNLYIFNIDDVRFKVCELCLPRFIDTFIIERKQENYEIENLIEWLIDDIRNSTTSLF